MEEEKKEWIEVISITTLSSYELREGSQLSGPCLGDNKECGTQGTISKEWQTARNAGSGDFWKGEPINTGR
jgi:hypothetical protein